MRLAMYLLTFDSRRELENDQIFMDTPDILENENSDIKVDDRKQRDDNGGNQRDEDVGNRSFLEEEKEGESRDVFEDEDMQTTLETSDQPHLVREICSKKNR